MGIPFKTVDVLEVYPDVAWGFVSYCVPKGDVGVRVDVGIW